MPATAVARGIPVLSSAEFGANPVEMHEAVGPCVTLRDVLEDVRNRVNFGNWSSLFS